MTVVDICVLSSNPETGYVILDNFLPLPKYVSISPKHLDRYVAEFAARHNMRDMSTEDQMTHLAAGMIGRRLMRRDLVADNGLSSGARGPKGSAV